MSNNPSTSVSSDIIQNDTLKKAFTICETVLKNAYNTHGINAGQTHFSDVWVRDSCFASWGALEINDTAIVQQFLSHTLNHMNDKGQCPLRIGQKYFLLKYIGLKGPQGPTYIEDKYVSIPMDSNALILILFNKYLKKTGDIEFAKNHYQKLKRALHFYDAYLSNGLVVEGPYAGWADSVKKRGVVLYTNVLYFEAINAKIHIANALGESQDSAMFKDQLAQVKADITRTFWNGNYFNDWVSSTKTQTTFSVEGNMLAMLFNISEPSQSTAIIHYLSKEKVMTPFGFPVVHRQYSWKDIYPPFLFIGLKDYHNGLIWFWISCISSVALHNNNETGMAMDCLMAMSQKIIRDNSVYEVYNRTGEPVKRLFYKSEEGFAWSAGLFVWAYQTLFNNPS